jgi:hypothetical protein
LRTRAHYIQTPASCKCFRAADRSNSPKPACRPPWTGTSPTRIVQTSPLALAVVMLRLLIRFMGLALLAGGFVALVVDGTRSLAGGSLYVTTLGSVLQALWPVAFQALRSAVLSRLPTFVWDPLLVVLLMTPVGVALCVLGAAFIVLSHKHHALVGYPPE